uniref:Si:ch211-171h4.3 n=1 Tax=Cyclopterus lumpus TaxID=8103 RepID=A0A8C2ZIK5_CYCLU
MCAATKLLDELCHLTAQSLTAMDTSEHFQVLKLLGEGSYGKVMLAVHKQRGTPMALKFFPRESTSLLSFLREYHLSLTFCAHPSLTRALGIAYSTPSHYVFAQQAGLFGDLYDVILPEVGVEEDACQRVVSQLCSALSHLHSLGFVHRDLKPENVFLCDSDCRRVKLGDFGMAVGARVPEVWYSSPYCAPESEIARVWVSVETGTDSWALGILTYAMLTGSHPWAETASDCRSYLKYREWSDGGPPPPPPATVVVVGVAPQFARFTAPARRFFRTLLEPRPRLRGRPEDALSYLGGEWVTEEERKRLEEERKRSRGKEGRSPK